MKIAFIDLETTGLPKQLGYDKYYPYQQLKQYSTSRMVQIACITCEVDFSEIKYNGACKESISKEKLFEEKIKPYNFMKVLSKHDYIIKPDEFEIKNHNIHGITNETAVFAGITLAEAKEKIKKDILNCETLVAHNIIFDKNILLSELYRIHENELINHINNMSTFCTSKGCADVTKIRYNSTKYKQPKLVELYNHLFGLNINNGLHNAIYDIENTVLCFAELVNRKYIDENIIKNWYM
jgi:hypothetical protein